MGKIGNFGKTIVFSTSDKKIMGFSNFKLTTAGRWATHESVRRKPRSEFLGAGLKTVNLRIVLNAGHGVRPRKTLQAIEKAIETGVVDKLIIGGKSIGGNRFKITAISETWDIVLAKGELYQATADLTFEEYL